MMPREPLGMVKSQPHLVPFDARWPGVFASLRAQLLSVLGDRVLSIHHVGSTSVPGLSAKPILDVLIGVGDLEASLACVPALAEMGFEYGPEDDIEDRRYFRGRRNGLRTHHVSIAEETSAQFINVLAFRDALRASPELAGEYVDLKRRLLKSGYKHEIHRGKTEFVHRVLRNLGSPERP